MRKTERKRLAMLQHVDARYSGWHRLGEFSRSDIRPAGLMRSGHLEEDLQHGYRYRLTGKGRAYLTGYIVDESGEVVLA